MGSRTIQVALLAALVVGGAGASAALGAGLRVVVRHTPNETRTNRTARTITGIVIHDTEGSFAGSIRTLQNPRVDGSAHFIVSRTGKIVQLVPVTDIAWHAGNRRWNLHSIGIEHVGYAARNDYTAAEYRASAELVAYLAHRWGIPLDRRHVIGHDEVPDPRHRGRFGGVDHHTDPGPHWNWAYYMSLVHHFAADPVRPIFVKPPRVAPYPHPFVAPGARVHGTVPWWSGIDAGRRYAKHIWKVAFIVDGKTLYTDHVWPYDFNRGRGWDTTTVPNGRHLLQIREYGTHHYRVRVRIPVRVDNPPMQVSETGAPAGDPVAGPVTLRVSADQPVTRYTLLVDGSPVSRDGSAPYSLAWNTSSVSDGPHTLVIRARGVHGHRGLLRVPVIVANSPTFPPLLAGDWLDRLDRRDPLR